MCEGSRCSTSLTTLDIVSVFDYGRLGDCEVVPHCISSSSYFDLPVPSLLNLLCAQPESTSYWFLFLFFQWSSLISPNHAFVHSSKVLSRYLVEGQKGWDFRVKISRIQRPLISLRHGHFQISPTNPATTVPFQTSCLPSYLSYTWPRLLPELELWRSSCYLKGEYHVNLEINKSRNGCLLCYTTESSICSKNGKITF